MSIPWRDEYSVNNEEIDNQHKKLFELLDRVEQSTHSLDFRNIIPAILDELVDYIHVHFESEENFMLNTFSPELIRHREIHEALKAEVKAEIELNFGDDYTTLKVMHLYNFLKDWIENHIIIEDHKY